MIGLIVLQLLAYDPTETYGELSVEKLLEKKRMLVEERSTFAGPTLTALAGFTVFGVGAALLVTAFTSNNKSCDRYGNESLCYAGGATAAVGAAALTFGLVWLLKRIDAWTAITARIGELDGLVDYKRSRPAAP